MRRSGKLNRRSFLGQVTAGSVVGSSLALTGSGAYAFQVTDRDPTDPAGRGRGTSGGQGQSGVTDRDPTDPAGRGRGTSGGHGQSGVTDRDPTDPAGRGRGTSGGHGQTGTTDSDSGYGADPAGRGRGTGGRSPGSSGGYGQQDDCTRIQRQIQGTQQAMQAVQAQSALSDAQLVSLRNEYGYAQGLAEQARNQDSEGRYAAFEQIRGIAARWGANCGPIDINCQLGWMRDTISREEFIRSTVRAHETAIAEAQQQLANCR